MLSCPGKGAFCTKTNSSAESLCLPIRLSSCGSNQFAVTSTEYPSASIRLPTMSVVKPGSRSRPVSGYEPDPIKTGLIAFGNNRIKRYIPRVWRNFLDFLTTKRNADQLWSKPLFSMTQMCKAAIVISASHADPVVSIVVRNRRRNDNVQTLRVEQQSANGFPDPEPVLHEFRFGFDFAEHHLRLTAQNRYEYALFCAPCAFDDCSGIDFIVHRQEAADGPARIIFGQFAHTLANACRGFGACIIRQGTPGAERTLTQ